MKKLTTLLGAIIIAGNLYSQKPQHKFNRSDIRTLITQAKNDLGEKDVFARPIEIRDDSSSCNLYYSKVGIVDLEEYLIKQRNPKGKLENIKKDFHKIHIVVEYDCKNYSILIRKEPFLFEEKSIDNQNQKKNPHTLIIKKQNNKYITNSDLKLRPLTEKYIKEIYKKSLEMSKRYFEK